MGVFLEKFAGEHPDQLHIVQLDNAPNRTAKKLIVPANVILLFQPPYSPEINPIERGWESIKYHLRPFWFINLDDVKEKVARISSSLTKDIIVFLAGWDCFTKALSL